jgi:hypothetical protein
VEKRKGQKSILFAATLGVFVMVGTFTIHAFGQQEDNVISCYESRDKVRGLEVKYLWFNHKSINEYAYLLESMLRSFPKTKVNSIDVSWTSNDDSRPFRSLELDSPYDSKPSFLPVSLKMRQEVEQDILFIGNGLPGKQFTFSFNRDVENSNFRLEMTLPELDGALVERAYSMALNEWRCEDYSSFDGKLLDSTKIEVNGDKLIFTSRVLTDSFEKYLN